MGWSVCRNDFKILCMSRTVVVLGWFFYKTRSCAAVVLVIFFVVVVHIVFLSLHSGFFPTHLHSVGQDFNHWGCCFSRFKIVFSSVSSHFLVIVVLCYFHSDLVCLISSSLVKRDVVFWVCFFAHCKIYHSVTNL